MCKDLSHYKFFFYDPCSCFPVSSFCLSGTDVSFQVPDKASYQWVDSSLNNSLAYNDVTLQEPLNSGLAKESNQSMALVLYQPQSPIAQTSTASTLSSSSSFCQKIVDLSNCSAKNSSTAESTSIASEQLEPDSTYDFYS